MTDETRHLEALPDDEPEGADFAGEHQDSTLADDPDEGEPESPDGRAGMD